MHSKQLCQQDGTTTAQLPALLGTIVVGAGGWLTAPPAAMCSSPFPALLLLCAGLCDAHVHCTAVTANLPGLLSLPESLVTAKAVDILEGMLSRGFTTIRDAGGCCRGQGPMNCSGCWRRLLGRQQQQAPLSWWCCTKFG